MKMVEFDCPSCGAHLRIDGTRSTAFCEYCGRKLYIDDEIKRVKVTIDNAEEAGYAFEQGRMNAQTESAGELADRAVADRAPARVHASQQKARSE